MTDQNIQFHSVAAALIKHAEKIPDALAIADGNRAYTYREFYRASAVAASLLLQARIKKGDRVVVECTQDAHFIITGMAISLIGAVFVPVETGILTDRLKDIYDETGAVAYIAPARHEFKGEFIEAAYLFQEQDDEFYGYAGCDAVLDDVAEILFSTGTTGKPKGIAINHGANVAVAENIQYGTMMHEGTTELVPLPLSHSHGLRTCYAHIINGSAVVIANGVVNVGAFFSLIKQYHVNALDLAPTMAKVLISIGKKGLLSYASQIEYIELGTAVLDEFTKDKLKEIFTDTRIYNFYGSTEAGRSCILDITKEDFRGCVGYPSVHSEFFITDEKRRVIDSSKDNIGLVAVKGAMMMDGYYGSKELTDEVLVDGCLYTSDLGYLDEMGRLIICGRADDVINYKGIKIAPDEIEGIAKGYKGIRDCACVGAPDALCGQVPVLYIELLEKDSIDIKKYKDFLRENLEAARVPSRIVVLDALPRSSNGKILRAQLRKEAENE